MTLPKLLPALAAAALLTACEARIGNDAPPVAENASAAGKAEEGRFTIEAPGFNMSVDIPESVRARTDVDNDDLVYPGSTIGGIHVQGQAERPDGQGGGEVELRFTTADAVDRVVAWYRDPARREDLTLQSERRDGGAFLLSGTAGDDGGRFTLRIAARAGGGTEARLLLSDRD